MRPHRFDKKGDLRLKANRTMWFFKFLITSEYRLLSRIKSVTNNVYLRIFILD